MHAKIFHSAGMLLICLTAWPLVGEGQDRGPDEDDQSRQRLIRKTRGQTEDDVMDRISLLMQQAGRRLTERFDAGKKTQSLQRQVLEQLDLAIRQAKQNLRRLRSSAQQSADQRREGQTSDGAQAEDDRRRNGAQPGDSESAGPSRDDVDAVRAGVLKEARRQWGHLPPRDREEILQGIHEDVSDKYRERIERYYEALADTPNNSEPRP
jgi:hypothetical protein